MKKCILLTIALVMLTMNSRGQDKDGELTVRISSGLVQGIIQEGTQAFLGIPYAEVERFMPPKPTV